MKKYLHDRFWVEHSVILTAGIATCLLFSIALMLRETCRQVPCQLQLACWSSLHMIWWIFVSNIMSIGVDLNCFLDLGFELLAFCTLQWFSAATTSQSFWQQLLFFVWVQCCESNRWVAGYMFSTDFGSSIQHAGRARLAGCLLAIQ